MSNRRKLWTPSGARQQEPQPEVRELDGGGPQLRLLVCRDEKTIDELPNYEGNPRDDVLLSDLLMKNHIYESGTTHEVALIKVPAKLWRDPKIQKRIVEQLSAGASKGLEEMEGGEDYYGTRNTYQEDALRCFNRHQRPKQGCIDYQNPDKRIGNPTSEGWKSGPRVYACNFCPVQAWVDKKKQEEASA